MEKSKSFNDVLSIITNNLVGNFELGDLLDTIVKMVMSLLDAEICSIFLDDKQNGSNIITMRAGSGFAERLVGAAKYQPGEGLTGYIYQTGEKFNIKSRKELTKLKRKNTNEPIWVGKHDNVQWKGFDQSKFRNLIGLPLKIREEVFGVIKVENKRGSRKVFDDVDESIFEIIANVVSLAIENARFHEKFEKQLKTVSAKAAHRINNKATDYDAIEYELGIELSKDICNHDNIAAIKERIHETTVSLKSMIDEFKQFGTPLKLDKSYYKLNKIIEQEVSHSQKDLTNIIIEKELDDQLPDLYIDGARFAEAIKELIRNSVRSINNSVRRNDGNIKIITNYDNINKTVTFRIEDNGNGFPKDFPVFEAFSSTDTEGTGLGLFTVRELVERHDGEICNYDLEYCNGAGIKFNIKTKDDALWQTKY